MCEYRKKLGRASLLPHSRHICHECIKSVSVRFADYSAISRNFGQLAEQSAKKWLLNGLLKFVHPSFEIIHSVGQILL
jgi:hypothetical protein